MLSWKVFFSMLLLRAFPLQRLTNITHFSGTCFLYVHRLCGLFLCKIQTLVPELLFPFFTTYLSVNSGPRSLDTFSLPFRPTSSRVIFLFCSLIVKTILLHDLLKDRLAINCKKCPLSLCVITKSNHKNS